MFKKLGTQLLGFTDGATWKNERKQNSKDWVGRNPGQHTRASAGATESWNRLPVPEEAGRDTAFGRDAAG